MTTTITVSPFRPYVPRLAARWDTDAPGERVRVLEASLLGLDISGFTALSERLSERGKLGAEELIVLISRCYSGLIDIAERYGGDVLKFRGDALLLLFDGERHERRAALAALGMQGFVAETGAAEASVGPVQLSMASGLVSGPCHFFLLGRHQRELVVCGPLGVGDARAGGCRRGGRGARLGPDRRGARRPRRDGARRRVPAPRGRGTGRAPAASGT